LNHLCNNKKIFFIFRHRFYNLDARLMAKRLAAEEGIMAGTSTGLNVVAALKIGAKLKVESKKQKAWLVAKL
jgi:cysteine synthase